MKAPGEPAPGGAWGEEGFGDGSRPATGSGWGLDPAPQAPPDVDDERRYVAMGRLGGGAMGVVEAVRDARLDREVARKRPAPGVPPALADAVLAHEARVTARLDHPNIVPVLDAGVDATGRRYFTMRLVRGRTLAEELGGRPTPWSELPRRIRQLLDVCRGLAHAHARGVVHADLKPANVLIGAQGEVQVSDWGLACVDAPGEGPPPAGVGAGTPPWRAPEVERGAAPGPAADVYAAGVVLREMLSGHPEREPTAAPAELVAVARRATAPDVAARYPDAAAMAAELERWLDGRPVLAYEPSPWDVLRRLIVAWRRRLLTALALLSAVAGAVGWGVVRTRIERDRALAAEAALTDTAAGLWAEKARVALLDDDRAEARRAALESVRLRPSPLAAGVLSATSSPELAVRDVVVPLVGCDVVHHLDGEGVWCSSATALRRLDHRGEVVEELPGAVLEAVPDGDGLVVNVDGALWRVDRATGARAWLRSVSPLRGLVVHDPPLYVTRRELVELRAPPRTMDVCPTHATVDAATSLGARWAVSCSDGQVVVGEGARGWTSVRGPVEGWTGAMAMAATGDRLLLGDLRGQLWVISRVTGETLAAGPSPLGEIRRVVVAPGGRLAAAMDSAGRVALFRTADAVVVARLDVAGARALRWDGDDALVVATAVLERWRVMGDATPSVWQEAHGVTSMALTPEGALVLGLGPEVAVREVADGGLRHLLRHHARTVKGVAWAGGTTVVSAAVDDEGAVAVIDVESGAARALPGVSRVRRVVCAAGPRCAASVYANKVSLFAPDATVEPPWVLPTELVDLVGNLQASVMFGVDAAGDVRRLEPSTRVAEVVARSAGETRLTLSADGRWLGIADRDGLRVVDVGTGAARGAPWPLTGMDGLTAVALDPTGAAVATGHRDGWVRITSLETGALRQEAPGHAARVAALMFAPDGTLWSGSWDGTVRRWERPDPGR